MTNQDIVHLLKSVAAAYTIKDEKKYKFQIIAYQKAADAVEHASTELKNLYEQKTLENLSGIGPTIKSRLEELFETGRVQHFEEVLSGISPAVFPLLDIPTFGPKKAYKIVTHFNLEDPKTVIEDIKKLAEVGKIAELESFGEKSQDDIIRAISEYATGTTKTNRMVLSRAFSLATVTDIDLPSISFLSSPFIASLASVLDSISTKPNPRLLPVSLSVMTFADETAPNCPNKFFKSSSEV